MIGISFSINVRSNVIPEPPVGTTVVAAPVAFGNVPVYAPSVVIVGSNKPWLSTPNVNVNSIPIPSVLANVSVSSCVNIADVLSVVTVNSVTTPKATVD